MLWNRINNLFDTGVHPTCGTHVHVRPAAGYTLDQMNASPKQLHITSQVREVVPIERKDCTWAQSNISQAELSPELK